MQDYIYGIPKEICAMKAVRLEPNGDGTYTAWIYSTSYTGSHEQCKTWLAVHGESL